MCENCWVLTNGSEKLSWPQACLPSPKHTYKTSLRLTKLSASWVPKMPTFSYGQQPPDRSWRSEAGKRSWGCSRIRAGSSPMLTVEDSLAGLVSERHVVWLCWCLQPQSLLYHGDSSVRWMLSVPWESQSLGTKGWTTHRTRPKDPVICCHKGCICCVLLAWKPFLYNGRKWYHFSAFRLPKEFNRQEGQKPRQTSSVLSTRQCINLASYYTWVELELADAVAHTALPVFLMNGYFGFSSCSTCSSLRAFS